MRSNWKGLKPKKLIPSIALAFVCGLFFASWQAGLVCLLLFSAMHDAYENKFKAPAMTIAHIGIGLVALGIFLLISGKQELEGVLKEGEKAQLAGYDIVLKTIETGIGQNYAYRRGNFEVWQGNKLVAELAPETRLFPIEKNTTTESSVYTHNFSDIYVVIGEPSSKGGFAFRAYYKPFMDLVWIGSAICAFGGFLGAFYRKKHRF
jgi:cytochrome c-type biogenesis protein CcmF